MNDLSQILFSRERVDMNPETSGGVLVRGASAVTVFLGVQSWADWASFAAFVYTMILIGEWVWKKVRAWRNGRK
jgi:hypothetical protein